ncbi:Mur ligase family protein [Leifsonia shinshuensis]|uniref:Mur ligase family protein n=1 Tax=Leifsonia shinshuensis TaxID=150026 RepID=UPI001F5056EA|nr:Mur ligase family protein [Leifsonia shinshuensis]
MKHLIPICIGKTARSLLRLAHRGSALPGLIVERIDAALLPDILGSLPRGVVVVAGTNGKTTTTRLVVEVLRAHHIRVFSNPSGSNYSRGILSSLLGQISFSGRLDADIAVLELDEGHAGAFVEVVPPRHSLILNVMRDQMDRYGEIDHTTNLLHQVAVATTDDVVVNDLDPRLHSGRFLRDVDATVSSFSASSELRTLFPGDDELLDADPPAPTAISDQTTLERIDPSPLVSFDGASHPLTLSFGGTFNTLNAVAALAICRAVLRGEFDPGHAFQALANTTPAFGRGELIAVNGQTIHLVLVKNPGAFRAALESYSGDGAQTMIALNDHDADGKDVSWIWDVDFTALRSDPVRVVTGTRAADLELRLHYDDITAEIREPNIGGALELFIETPSPTVKRIYCTYTAMLAIRRTLRPGILGEAA